MEVVFYFLLALAFIFVLKSLIGLSFSSMGGVSLSTRDSSIFIKGKVLSVEYQGNILMGDTSLKDAGSNSMTHSVNGCSVSIKGGHVKVVGTCPTLIVNGKRLI